MPYEPFPAPPAFASEMFTVGVTGTNGKTTTTTLIARAFSHFGGKALRVTTLGAFLVDDNHETKLDVAETYDGFLEAMRRGRQAGVERVVLELTSESLALGFAKAWPIRIGVFTNLTRDHWDAHGSAEHYLASKAQLFVHLTKGGAAVLHASDPASRLLAEIVPPHARLVWYGVGASEDLPLFVQANSVQVSWEGTLISLSVNKQISDFPSTLKIKSIGAMYAEDALGALAASILAGVPAKTAVEAIAASDPLPGRFQVIGGGPRAVVDYAHSPDALRRTLITARSLTKGRLFVVFGAGGDRDKGKRAAMGEAARLADRIIVTTDNPRSESPLDIAEAITQGIGPHPDQRVILDRREAITQALRAAGPEDVVLIAGRGPETEQSFSWGKLRLSDEEVVVDYFEKASAHSIGSSV